MLYDLYKTSSRNKEEDLNILKSISVGRYDTLRKAVYNAQRMYDKYKKQLIIISLYKGPGHPNLNQNHPADCYIVPIDKFKTCSFKRDIMSQSISYNDDSELDWCQVIGETSNYLKPKQF